MGKSIPPKTEYETEEPEEVEPQTRRRQSKASGAARPNVSINKQVSVINDF